jgi:hypothetical protein
MRCAVRDGFPLRGTVHESRKGRSEAVAPSINSSTREERAAYVRERYQCIANCDLCGLCKIFHGKDPEQALAAYIDGEAELSQVMMRYRGR